MAAITPTLIINIVELIWSILVGGLWARISYAGEVSRFQVIDVVVYGYLIVSIALCIAPFLGESISKNVRFLIAGTGFILWLTAGGLLLDIYAHPNFLTTDEASSRIVAGGVFSLFNVCTYAADLFFVYTSSTPPLS